MYFNMTFVDNEAFSVGIDVGTSGIRLLLLNTKGKIIKRQIVNYKSLNDNKRIWNDEKRIDVVQLRITVLDLVKIFSNTIWSNFL